MLLSSWSCSSVVLNRLRADRRSWNGDGSGRRISTKQQHNQEQGRECLIEAEQPWGSRDVLRTRSAVTSWIWGSTSQNLASSLKYQLYKGDWALLPHSTGWLCQMSMALNPFKIFLLRHFIARDVSTFGKKKQQWAFQTMAVWAGRAFSCVLISLILHIDTRSTSCCAVTMLIFADRNHTWWFL